ncbi:hypothetical protein ES288_D09G098300v1 [Gossypium darwinii]|uniref:Uncharacterized protein n=1 Tax=Gossypium darwinii TaxID=34276 RepID=A0A5D2B7J8_GOSDA|nr:hypothetical protein ES288_D09G098300v1 [Gossypium darwinii]
MFKVYKLCIPHLRPVEYKRSRLPGNRRTVNRAIVVLKKVLKIQKPRKRFHQRTSSTDKRFIMTGSNNVVSDFCFFLLVLRIFRHLLYK